MLILDREKGGPKHLFPKVKAGLVPVLANVGKVIRNLMRISLTIVQMMYTHDWPDDVCCLGTLAISGQPVDVRHKSDGP